uniref:uncharacterized protein LOC101303730 n=1 Tax=Fragaria vesca subsp. vesca TaxID=101020 RepID=UPI0005CAD5EA|nr:PREDICTED: uncharacterized protein LOC101303730 [Fragaria vesca subsp. vesca]XP_011466745.1 PREDICTED: uncharacterized protein LOC101303730 [Fragaria vesca subsp. vesca]
MNMDILAEEEEEINRIICVCASIIELYYEKYIHKIPCMDSSYTGNIWLMKLLEGNESRCHNMFRMNKDVFMRLCNDLENIYKLKGSRRICIAEKLGMFLYTLGEGAGNRNVQERFQHSGETVSRYFSELLDVICVMATELIKPLDPEFKNTPAEILGDSRYMPHFKDCIGAIDDIHVQAKISPSEQVPYIGRKGIPTQNIMAVCNFDMQFTFACAGWEGTAHDARVFQSAVQNPTSNFPKPPNGNCV